MKKLLSRIFTTLGFSLIIIGLIFSTFPSPSYAADLELIGKDLGLVITPANERLFDLRNLNPGDTKIAKLKIKNDYKNPFNLYMRAERIGEIPLEGETDLFNILTITVTIKDIKIYEGLIKDFAISSVSLGRFNSGSNEELIATIHLPGLETGNEYQGKSADVKWIFIAESITPSDDGGSKKDKDYGPWKPPVIIEDEEIPKGEPELEESVEEPIEEPIEEIEEIEEEIPKGKPVLPKTGELSLLFYYISGTAMVLIGLSLQDRNKK